MFRGHDEEIEEVRELLYNLLKDYPTGATSTFLEELYKKNYVDTGIARPLPAEWLRYIKQADEFEVKSLSNFTMLYIVNVDSSSQSVVWSPDEEKSTNQVLDSLNKNDDFNINEIVVKFSNLEPMSLASMPAPATPVRVQIVSATDPENINIRLCSWDPLPDYLQSALTKIPDSERLFPNEINNGDLFAAEINQRWERVTIVRKSRQPDFWVVFTVDSGFFHILHENSLWPLTEAVGAFKKIFLARIKLAAVQPLEDGTKVVSKKGPTSIPWSREIQRVVRESLCNSSSITIEFTAAENWCYTKDNLPFCMGTLTLNGEDLSKRLISMNLASST